MSELEANGVEIYRFPIDDETVAEINSQMNVSLHPLYVYAGHSGPVCAPQTLCFVDAMSFLCYSILL